MRAEVNLLSFGGKPFKFGVVDDVIQRQEPPKIGVGLRPVPAIPDVGNSQRPVDGLVGDSACQRMAVAHANTGYGFFDGQFQVQEALNKTGTARMVGVEKRGVLGPGEHAAVEADHRNPLGIVRAPTEGFQGVVTAAQVRDQWVLGVGRHLLMLMCAKGASGKCSKNAQNIQEWKETVGAALRRPQEGRLTWAADIRAAGSPPVGLSWAGAFDLSDFPAFPRPLAPLKRRQAIFNHPPEAAAAARLKRQAEHDARAVERIKPYLVDQGLSCQATADVLNLGDLNAKAILSR